MQKLKDYIDRNFFVRYIIVFILVSHLMLLIQNYKAVTEGWTLGLPFSVIYGTMFSFSSVFTNLSLTIFVINILLMSYLITDIITLYKIEKDIFSHSKKIGASGMLAIIGTHCASCGSAILTGIFGSSLATVLPLGGVEFGILSIVILSYSIFKINKKLNNPYVC